MKQNSSTGRSPEAQWGLGDWMVALNLQATDLAALLESAGGRQHKTAAGYISDIKRQKQHVSTPEDAFALIRALNHAAQHSQNPVMSCAALLEHAALFLKSPAICSFNFFDVLEAKLYTLCDTVGRPDLINWVRPRPPLQLFGREADQREVLSRIRDYPVTMITGVGGNGKTALAWFAANQAVRSDLGLKDFDWITDRRDVWEWQDSNTPAETSKHPEPEPLNFDAILRSMIRCFDWSDLIGKPYDHLLKHCQEYLQRSPYLLVIDNLDTVPGKQEAVEKLLNLLGRGQGQTAVSRALITSREKVTADCAIYPLGGIAREERTRYIRYLQRQYAMPELTDTQCEQLGDETHGNPLLIQMAMQRYDTAPPLFDQIIHDLKSGSNFAMFFGPLIKELAETFPQAYWLALCAAHLPIIHSSELELYWLEVFPKEGYHKALKVLRQKMILEMLPNGDMTMHPLIQSYLRSL